MLKRFHFLKQRSISYLPCYNIVKEWQGGITMEKKPVKIVTIGGGSSYTPELMEGFIKRYDELPIKEIWLVKSGWLISKMEKKKWKSLGPWRNVCGMLHHMMLKFI